MTDITTVSDNWSPARRQYEQDGYVIFRDVVDMGLIEEMRGHVDWLLKKHPDLRPEQLHHSLITDDPFWVRVISDERLLDVAEQFIGANIALFGTHYISKRPKDGQAVLFHQDGAYWPLEPMEVTTLWLALDDSTPENGCMRVIPGTQHENLMEMTKTDRDDVVLDAFLTPDHFDESKAVDLVLNAGDVSVHHPNVIHGSNANTSDGWRRCLTMRYIPTTTKILSDQRDPFASAFHVRGEDPGVNTYNARPKYIEGEWMPFQGCEEWA